MENEKMNKISRKLVSDNTDYMSAFRYNLNMYLSEKEMTIRSLSEDADIPIDTLKNLIYGNTRDIKVSTIISLAKALNISIDELIGAGTICDVQRESLAICRNLPDNSLYLVRWFIRHQEQVNNNIPKGKHIINVMLPEYLGNGNLKPVNEFTQLDISHLQNDIKHKVFMGVRLNCEHYMPVYSPYDVLLIANDRLPKSNENCVIICGENIFLGKRTICNNCVKYFSIRDGKFRVNEDEIDEVVGYIAGVIR